MAEETEAQKRFREAGEKLKTGIAKEKTVVKQEIEQNLATVRAANIGIRGLDSIDPSRVMSIPFVRLVQFTSRKTTQADGKEASVGSFFFNDTKKAVESIEMVILRAKIGKKTFVREGEESVSSILAILAATLDTKKMFILTLSTMSFRPFGVLMAQMKEEGVIDVWDHKVKVASQYQENNKGKFYVAQFSLGDALTTEEAKEMEDMYASYGRVLERQSFDETEEGVEAPADPGEPTPF